MTPLFETCFSIVLGHEKGFTDDPRDRGNWTGGQIGQGELKGTKFGISAASYPALDIRNLTLNEAREIYWRDYWSRLRCGDLPAPVALVCFDAAVHAGQVSAALYLQRAVQAAPDGLIGPRTITAAQRAAANSVRDLVAECLAQRNEANRVSATVHIHGMGWSRRLFTLAFQAVALEAWP